MSADGPSTTVAVQFRPGRVMGWFLIVSAVVGTAAFALLSHHGLRAGASFLGGLLVAGGVFSVGQFNLRMANQISVAITLAVAMFSYLIAVVGLGVLLAASSPSVVDPVAIASGLITGVVGWIGRLIDVLRVRPERR